MTKKMLVPVLGSFILMLAFSFYSPAVGQSSKKKKDW